MKPNFPLYRNIYYPNFRSPKQRITFIQRKYFEHSFYWRSNYRSVARRTDAFYGNGLSLLGRSSLPAQVWTRAFPVGVTVRRATELVKMIMMNGSYSILIKLYFWSTK